MERLDKNLWYRVKRFSPQPNLQFDPITENYRKTGIMRREASHQPGLNAHVTGGEDQNLFFRMPNKSYQPNLPKRVFNDLDPKTRISRRLPRTRAERQQSAVVRSLQSISDSMNAFISTPELDNEGNPILDRDGNPKMKIRTLNEILTVSHESLIKALNENNVAINNNLTIIIGSFSSIQIANILAKLRGITARFPDQNQLDRDRMFKGAIIEERLLSNDELPNSVEHAIGEELEEKGMSDMTDNWDIPYTADFFPARGFTRNDWADARKEIKVKEYILGRQARAPGLHVMSSGGIPLDNMFIVARQFAPDRQHVLDLQTLQFIAPTNVSGMARVAQAHS